MSDDFDRAVRWAEQTVHEAPLGIRGPETVNAASQLLMARDTLARLRHDRHDQDVALLDEVRSCAALADELAFWKYQAIWGRTYLLDPKAIHRPFVEDGPSWKEAERQLENFRREENRERVSQAEAPRDPGAT